MLLELLHRQQCSQNLLYQTHKWIDPRAGWDLHTEGDRADILRSDTKILPYLSGVCAFLFLVTFGVLSMKCA